MTNEQKSALLRKWMKSYGKLIYSVAYKITLNEQDTEDIFQETFTKAYFKLPKLANHANIKAWLCMAAKNRAINLVTSSWSKKVELTQAPYDIAPQGADSDELVELIKKLTYSHRQCIWLYYYVGYKTAEIADLLGVPDATVRTRLRRAREQLKCEIVEIHGGKEYEY